MLLLIILLIPKGIWTGEFEEKRKFSTCRKNKIFKFVKMIMDGPIQLNFLNVYRECLETEAMVDAGHFKIGSRFTEAI